jgi:hypothetical protein
VVCFVEHQHLKSAKINGALLDMIEQSSGAGDDDIYASS